VHTERSIEKELKERDSAFINDRYKRIHIDDYEFDPFTFITDRKIPKGQILQAIRDSSKDR
jgi:hypothetical protein